MVTTPYNVATYSSDQKRCYMITISYNVATYSPDYITAITVEIVSKKGAG
jgi:hypothetical protein